MGTHRWAHPRSRGENDRVEQHGRWTGGSSPLTRGKLIAACAGAAPEGLIPAHAGKTPCVLGTASDGPAHPRSRGENNLPGLVHADDGGSSPLTRGKLDDEVTGEAVGGLIPAHAGKTDLQILISGEDRAHPRSRGENRTSRNRCTRSAGSSPLTRGKLRSGAAWRARRGLIPAHAGKTPHGRRLHTSRWAHPRSRGENKDGAGKDLIRWGSSPLTRGKLDVDTSRAMLDRLIPAHAGKTGGGASLGWVSGAHPRSRGENNPNSTVQLLGWGSSPLTRGKLQCGSPFPGDVRLIPAHAGKTCACRSTARSVCGSSPLTRGKLSPAQTRTSASGLIPAHAGKTSRRRCRRWRAGAHPRSRGENHCPAVGSPGARGSSPLTRGKLGLGREASAGHGLIPAHAGKTSSAAWSWGWQGAHPRSRGENIGCLVGAIVAMGSSPLTRGKPGKTDH